MRTETVEIYKFNELSESAKENALENLREINIRYGDWWDSIYDMYKCDTPGFEIDNIYFSGFWSQGDGAMFEGCITDDVLDLIKPSYRNEAYNRDFYKVINLIKKDYISVFGKFKQYGHYYHHKSYSDTLEYEFINDSYGKDYSNVEEVLEDILEEIREHYEDVCMKLYRDLEKEYEYLTSEEAIIETIECNEYEFTKDGEQF